jgi:hypothetical protein
MKVCQYEIQAINSTINLYLFIIFQVHFCLVEGFNFLLQCC